MTVATARCELVGAEEWGAIAARFADLTYRQTPAYCEAIASRRSSASEYVAVRSGDALVAAANVRVKRLPVVGGGLAYVSGGPLHQGPGALSRDALREGLRALRARYAGELGMVLRVVLSPRVDLADSDVSAVMNDEGFSAAETRYRTIAMDLEPGLDALRAAFKQKWRNCLNKSERQGLEVTSGHDRAHFEEFARLHAPFVEHKGFDVDLDAPFFAGVAERTPDGEGLRVFLARQGGTPVAGVLASFHGDTAVYLLGAADDEGRKSNAAYLLQWSVMREAAARSIRWYDLGGVDPDGNPGVHRFKVGMGGADIDMVSTWEARPGALRSMAVLGGESVYRWMKK